MTTLKTKILDTIKSNTITMIPRWKFVVYSVFGTVGFIFTFLLGVFFLSLILFLLSRYGFMYMSFFHFLATVHALRAIPIALLICTVILLILTEVISRQYAFSFRRPLAVTLLASTSCAVIASFIISEIGLHEFVHKYARDHHIGVMERVYERPIPFKTVDGIDIIRGVVLSLSPTTTTVRLFDGATVVVFASSTNGQHYVVPAIGEDVVVFGTFTNDMFQMIDIRKAPRPLFGNSMHGMKMQMMEQSEIK